MGPAAQSRGSVDKPVVVIGGGISGLATAGLLAKAGHRVTLLEQRSGLGGRSGRHERDGFRFDTGPSWYLMPEVVDHWFRLMGTSAAEQLDLVRLDPAYRTWFEGHPEVAEVRSGREHAVRLFEQLQPGSGSPLRRYLDEAAETYRLAKDHFLYDDFASFRGLAHPRVLRRAPRLAKLLGWSLDRYVRERFAEPRQQQVLGYPAVFLGTSPFRAPAMYHLMSHLDLDDGVYYPMGGFAALVDAMERLAREAGVRIETRATVRRIITGPAGDKARCEAVVWTDAEGAQQRTPARTVVAAADLHHVETELLPAQLRSHPEPVWRRRDPGPSAVLVCLGVRGKLPELAHHNLLFTRDWKDNFGRIQAGRVLAQETSIYVCKPSATDDGVAPAGDENLFILVPTPAAPAWGSGGDDGEGSAIVESVADAAIDQLAAWAGIENLRGRIEVRRTFGPADFVDGFNAWRGSALGAAHTLRQSAFLRPGNRSGKVEGLHYAGSSVRPGIGVPMCLISAELVLKAVQGIKAPGALPEPGSCAEDGSAVAQALTYDAAPAAEAALAGDATQHKQPTADTAGSSA
ncbi:phytoene desaturase family protein [Arthrobacter sp. NPDC089319]|uniref:phytoene desaturase family protein n=1 Tax=Arthrobacter sp. NPDC089319 TaxID=3155915 RepID=UPI003413BE24